MEAETISMAAGAALSLLFSYGPGVAQWFAALGVQEQDGGARKRLVMLALLVAVAAGALALSCARLPVPGSTVACSQAGAWELAKALVLAIMANQGVYALSPRIQGYNQAVGQPGVAAPDQNR
jgi:hypothetical protein